MDLSPHDDDFRLSLHPSVVRFVPFVSFVQQSTDDGDYAHLLLFLCSSSPLLLLPLGYQITPISWRNETKIVRVSKKNVISYILIIFNFSVLCFSFLFPLSCTYFCKIRADRFIMKTIIAFSSSFLSFSSFSNMRSSCLNKLFFKQNEYDEQANKHKNYYFHISFNLKIFPPDHLNSTYSLICGSFMVSFQFENSLFCISNASRRSCSSRVLSFPTSSSYRLNVACNAWIALFLYFFRSLICVVVAFVDMKRHQLS